MTSNPTLRPRSLFVIGFALAPVALVVFGLVDTLLARADFGTNWTAQYWDNPDFSGDPEATVTGINGINFNWGDDSPDDDIDNDTFSARFSSSQVFSQGTYEFVVSSDDGVRVYIDGVIVLDRFVARPLTTDRFTQTLSAGTHSLLVEYFENEDEASIQFQWFLVSGGAVTPGSSVTQSAAVGTPLATSVPTAPPPPPPTGLPPIPAGALTATVIDARVLNIRQSPSLGAPEIGEILRGQTYAVVGRDERAYWFLLQLSGYQGWALGNYLFINGNEFNAPVVSSFILQGNPAAISAVVAQARITLRLRAQPTTASEQIGRVRVGDVVPVIGRTRDGIWWQVVDQGTTGWIYAGESTWVTIWEGEYAQIPIVE